LAVIRDEQLRRGAQPPAVGRGGATSVTPVC